MDEQIRKSIQTAVAANPLPWSIVHSHNNWFTVYDKNGTEVMIEKEEHIDLIRLLVQATNAYVEQPTPPERDDPKYPPKP